VLCSASVDPFLSWLSVPSFVCSVVCPCIHHTRTRCESIDRSVHIHPYTQTARDTDREVTSRTKRVHDTSHTASNRVSTYHTHEATNIYEHSRRNVGLPVSPLSPLPPSPPLPNSVWQCVQWVDGRTEHTYVKRALVMLCLRARKCVCVHRTSTTVHSHTHIHQHDTRAAPLREPPNAYMAGRETDPRERESYIHRARRTEGLKSGRSPFPLPPFLAHSSL